MARKGSRPKARPSKGGKDQITGFNAEIWGNKFYSDKVYDMKEMGLADTDAYSKDGGAYVEYELGRNAIAMTMYQKGALDRDGVTNLSSESTVRLVFTGDFAYNKDGALKSGYVRETASWSYSKQKEGGIFEYSSVDTTSNAAADSLYAITQTWESGEKVFDNITYPNNTFEGNPKSDFYNFESSKYFEDGWWDNPFDTNLI